MEYSVNATSSVLKEALTKNASSKEEFLEQTGQLISSSISYILDDEEHFDHLEGCEKSYLGPKFEKLFLKNFSLPFKSKTENTKMYLDTRIADTDVDIKFSISNGWIIPPKNIDNWCLLSSIDFTNKTYSMGFLKTTKEVLTNGQNWDKKYSVSAEGRKHIDWITQDYPLPPIEYAGERRLMKRYEKRLLTSSKLQLSTEVPNEAGIYALYHWDTLVYIGKAVKLSNKIRAHIKKIEEADITETNDILVQYLSVPKHLTFAVENYLIAEHKPIWNNTGFQKSTKWNTAYGLSK